MDERQRVLEAGCGGGKLCVPLARAGHEVTGMDREAHMLQFARAHAASLPNLRVRQGDIIAQAWGGKYDVAILGANLLVNLVTDRASKRAQKNLLERAHVQPDVRFTTWEDFAIMAMAERGLGVGILPDLILRRIPYRIEIRPLANPYYRPTASPSTPPPT